MTRIFAPLLATILLAALAACDGGIDGSVDLTITGYAPEEGSDGWCQVDLAYANNTNRDVDDLYFLIDVMQGDQKLTQITCELDDAEAGTTGTLECLAPAACDGFAGASFAKQGGAARCDFGDEPIETDACEALINLAAEIVD